MISFDNVVEDKLFDKLKAKNYNLNILIVFLVTSIASLAMFLNFGALMSEDMLFYVSRIHEIANNISHGVWLPAIQDNNVLGMGYLLDVFYPSIMLYPGAILHMLGLSAEAGIVVNVFLNNIISMILNYIIAKMYYKDDKSAFYFSVIYAILPFKHILNLLRGLVGSYFATSFLPLVVLGCILLKRDNKWQPLAIGMILVAYSHLLSLFLCGLFVFIYFFIINFKNTFKNIKVLCNLAKATVTSIIVSLAFLVPLLQNLLETKYKLELNAKLAGIDCFDLTFGLFDSSSLGFCVFTVIFQTGLIFASVKLYKFLFAKFNDKIIAAFLAVIPFTVFSLTNLFPWGLFEKLPLFSSIQFSFRPLLFFFVLLSLFLVKLIVSTKDFNVVFILAFMSILLSLTLIPNVSEDPMDIISYNKEDGTYLSVVGGEYIPLGFYDYLVESGGSITNNDEQFDWSSAIVNGELKTNIVSRSFHTRSIVLTEPADEVILNLLYYKNYDATINGEHINLFEKNGLVCLNKVAAGELIVKYEVDITQYFSAIISFVAAFWFVMYLCLLYKKTK